MNFEIQKALPISSYEMKNREIDVHGSYVWGSVGPQTF